MSFRYAWLIAAAVVLATSPVSAAAAVPSFIVQDMGIGVPVDVNADGTIVGQDSFSPAQPWVLEGRTKTFLPLPAGVTTAKVNRINDQGVVVGDANGRPLVWWPTASGYQLTQLPMPDGATVGTAVDVNSDGVVLLSFGTQGSLPSGYTYIDYKPYLHSQQTGLIDLSSRYLLPPYPEAVDLTDGGRILLKSGDILEPTGEVTPTPLFPESNGGYSWTFFRASRINEAGTFIGVATLSSSMGYAQAVKFTPGSGWKVLGGLNVSITANGIDTAGNALILANYVCPANYGLAYAPASGGTYCLDDLILDEDWSFLSFTAKGALASGEVQSDGTSAPAGLMAAYGYDAASGSGRLALIIPAGDLPLPPATTAKAVAHPATSSQPYDAITVSWTSAGDLAKKYVVERKGPGETAFTKLTEVPATVTVHNDTSIGPLATYTYRIAAVGLAGTGPYSNETSARAPGAADTTSPLATITAPANGATVKGTVTVSATFTDDVGLVYAGLTFSPTLASDLICEKYPGTAAPTLTLSCNWDTARRVAYQSPSATVYAYGYDALGNWVRTSVTVNVTYSTRGGGKPRR